MSALRLTAINIYPIKSLGGIALEEARVLGKGLFLDRRWMLVDESGTFMTQRLAPKMALFKLSLDNNHLIVNFMGHSVSIPCDAPFIPVPLQVTIWDDTVQAFEVNESYSEWFSKCLEMPCRLVYFPEESPRPVDPRFKVNEEHVSLADGYPFLIIGEATLDDLNSRLDVPLPMNRFRPNFVFTGGTAFEEDTWRDFIIGSVKFVGVKPCGRCVLITIDQDTAEKGIEPLLTLSKYRKVDNKVNFGMNLVAREHGIVRVGDEIIVN